jgi:uncharacterized membrane protein YdfJ with MMPL/SSD domain
VLFEFGCAMYRHRRAVLAAWAIAVLLAVPIAPGVVRSLNAGGFSSPDLEAFRASQLLAQRFGSNPSELVLVFDDPQGELGVAADDPRFSQAVQTALADLGNQWFADRVVTAEQNSRQVAPDLRAQYVTITLGAHAQNVREILPAIERALRPTPLRVTLTGAPVFYDDIFDVTERDLRRAELLSIPTAAVALVIVFGSVVAGVVPGVIGGAAVAITLALMTLAGRFFELSIFSLNLATMLGLGLGIDYSLFIVSRFREELARSDAGDRLAHGGDEMAHGRPDDRSGRRRGAGVVETVGAGTEHPLESDDSAGPRNVAATPATSAAQDVSQEMRADGGGAGHAAGAAGGTAEASGGREGEPGGLSEAGAHAAGSANGGLSEAGAHAAGPAHEGLSEAGAHVAGPGNGGAIEAGARFEGRIGATDVERAVGLALATAGRAVLYSGATVLIGLLALLTFDITALRSMGMAGALVVGLSVLAALTLLPALLGVLGTRVDRLAIRPLAAAARRAGHGRGFWTWLAETVMRRPVQFLVPLLVLLIGLGLPFLRVDLGAPDASILPTDVQSRRGFDLLRAHWGDGELSPILLVFQTTSGASALDPPRVQALSDFMRRVQAHASVARTTSVVTIDSRITPQQYAAIYADPTRIRDAYAQIVASNTVRGDTVLALVTSKFGQTDDRSKDLVRAIRATPPPDGFTLLVGGGTAGVIDYADRLYEQFPRAAVLVVLAIYLVLLRTFGSVVIPLKAVAMNVLSLLASYGALVVIFQDGALANVLNFQPLGFVEASLPIVMFCVLFGLSMDYEVFLLSRVHEAYLDDGDNAASVARGLERSGRIITSAAAIVVLVSLSFVAADIVLIKALGLGTAIAVLLDATLVRALLVPATMRLLGDWNWWAPAWLRRWVCVRNGYSHG